MTAFTKQSLVVLVPSLLLAVACSSTEETEKTSTTGASLTTDILADTDVAQIKYEITRVECSPGETFDAFSETYNEDLNDIMLPGGLDDFTEPTFDEESEHVFADHFVVLDEGCYDVTTTPVKGNGDDSKHCFPATEEGVVVTDGQVTEILLINQCLGQGKGAIDALSVTNSPPLLLSMDFDKSKFVERCADQVMCVTATDPNNDPITFIWEPSDLQATPPEVLSTAENPDGSITQCVKVIPQEDGKHNMKVIVLDQFFDLNGDLIAVEDYLADAGYPNESRDELEFPFYAADQGPIPEPDEICGDGLDNDCNGVPDDGCGTNQVECDEDFAASGQFTTEVYTVEMGQPDGTFELNYETYSIPDTIIVEYEGVELFKYDCGGTNGWTTEPITYSGSDTFVTVTVVGGCDDPFNSGTAWMINTTCPE